MVDEVEGEAPLDAEVALVRDVLRLGRDLDDPLAVSGSTFRSIWQPTPQNVHVVFVLVRAASRAVRALDELLVQRAGRAHRRGSRRRARTRCRATSAPRSGRRAPRPRGPRARAPSTASPPACSGRSARRGCRPRGRSPSAGRGRRTARARRPGRTIGASTSRSRASASSSFGAAGRAPVQVLGEQHLGQRPLELRHATSSSRRPSPRRRGSRRPAAAAASPRRRRRTCRQPPYGSSLSSWQSVGDEDAVPRERVDEELALSASGLRPSSVKRPSPPSTEQPPRAARPARAMAERRSAPGTATPGRARRSTSAPSPRATRRPSPVIAASPCWSSSARWWSARLPIRHGVHFWHDSSAKNRIVSASRRSTGYEAGKTWTAAEPGPAPHSRERLAGQRHVERGRRQDPARRAAGDDRADLARSKPPRVVVDQLPRRDVERRLVAARLATAPETDHRAGSALHSPPARIARRARASRRC